MEKNNEPVGMYGETQRIQVGKYSICRQDDISVWIENEDGEGGAFIDELFEGHIEKFFNEHF